MKFAEIKDLTVEELRKRYKALREEMFEMKMKHSLGQLSDPSSIRAKRRDVARIKTAVNSKLAQ